MCSLLEISAHLQLPKVTSTTIEHAGEPQYPPLPTAAFPSGPEVVLRGSKDAPDCVAVPATRPSAMQSLSAVAVARRGGLRMPSSAPYSIVSELF